MKKTYSKPEMLCINVQLHQIICTSGITNVSGADVSMGGDTGEHGIVSGNARSGGIWDSED